MKKFLTLICIFDLFKVKKEKTNMTNDINLIIFKYDAINMTLEKKFEISNNSSPTKNNTTPGLICFFVILTPHSCNYYNIHNIYPS